MKRNRAALMPALAICLMMAAGCGRSDTTDQLTGTDACHEIADIEGSIIQAIETAQKDPSKQADGRTQLGTAVESFRRMGQLDNGEYPVIAKYLFEAWSPLALGGDTSSAGLLLAKATAQFKRVCGYELPTLER